VVTVTLDHAFQQSQVLIVNARQPVLVNDQHTLTVTDVEHIILYQLFA
jgi:hypothetical protein